jgi:CheY-like chemotaxis protein/predicted Zn-dependent protease
MAIWSLDNKKVLIVDDFMDMRQMMRSIVESLGKADIQTARNGNEAVSMIEFNRFDIIFCDYNLGEGKDGQQVLEEARYRELLPFSTVFIMVTAENSSMMVLGALEHAPDDYLSKPIVRAPLISRLRHLMDKKERLKSILSAMDRRCWLTALKRCAPLLESGNKGISDVQQLKGILLLELGEYELAAQFYRDIIEERPLAWALLGLGKALCYSRQYAQAQEILESLAKLQPRQVALYDLLADCFLAQNDWPRAKESLDRGIAVSPKTAMRHRHLGQIALHEGDLAAAIDSFKTALHLSQGSYLRSHGEYADLMRAYILKGEFAGAAQALKNMQREYKQNPAALLQGNLLEWAIQCQSSNAEAALPKLNEALEKCKKQPELLTREIALFIGNICLQQRREEQGLLLLRHAIRNQPDDGKNQAEVLAACTQAGLAAQGQQLLAEAAKDLAGVEAKAGQLAKQGQHEAAFALLEESAQPLPENISLNLSAAQRALDLMQKQGKTAELMQKTRFFLDRVRGLANSDSHYRQLRTRMNQLASGLDV